MTSSHESARWTCPHCFIAIPWSDRAAVDTHMCDGIRELIKPNTTATARLDHIVKTLENNNAQPAKKRGRYRRYSRG